MKKRRGDIPSSHNGPDRSLESRKEGASILHVMQERLKEQRKKAEEEEARKQKAYNLYLDAADYVYELERCKKEYAPKTRDEEWDGRFVKALTYLDEARDLRDWYFDQAYGS